MKNSGLKYHETSQPSRRGTRMTQIARIFTDPRASASSTQSVFYRRLSAFICVHLRLISVSLSDRTRKIKFELFPIQEKIESANNDQIHSCLNLSKNKTQGFGIDERRFIVPAICSSLLLFDRNQQNNHFFAPFAYFAVKSANRSKTTLELLPHIFDDILKVGVNFS